VKVISAPNPGAWAYRVSCTNCGTIVEVGVADLTAHHDQREGSCAEWRCPTCSGYSSRNFIAWSLIPENVRHAIR
jgi:hypothetical protein